MHITQEKPQFSPINIKLNTAEEAQGFFDIIDKLEDFRVNWDSEITPNSFTEEEISIIISLSNARTNGIIVT